MIDLDGTRWSTLQQAYGSAESIPALLRKVRPSSASVSAEAWNDLWSALWHQSDVYTASYAAVPHLVAWMEAAPDLDWFVQAVHLVAMIEAYRHRRVAPAIPCDLESEYAGSVARLPALICSRVGKEWDAGTARILCGALAIVKGHSRLGSAVVELEGEVLCPHCDEVFAPPGWNLDE